MSRKDIAELWESLRVAMVADADLATVGITAIYEGWPNTAELPDPFMAWSIQGNRPTLDDSVGLSRATIELSINASTLDKCREIRGIIESAWDIPRTRSAEVESTNYRLTELRVVNSVELPGFVRSGEAGKKTKQITLELAARVSRITS